MLDNNFIGLNKNGKLIKIQKDIREQLIDIIEKDSQFLARHRLMDYSLLLQMEKIDPNKAYASPRNIWMSIDGTHCYHISIIDYLQEWDIVKKTEIQLKRTFKGEDPKKLSAAHPIYYQERFFNFMRDIVFLPQNEVDFDSRNYNNY